MSSSRKINRDHAKKKQRPMVEDEVIASHLSALLTPALTSQENYYRQLGLRDRILNLPLMVAAVLTLLWRDVVGVTELTRMLARDVIAERPQPDWGLFCGIQHKQPLSHASTIICQALLTICNNIVIFIYIK